MARSAGPLRFSEARSRGVGYQNCQSVRALEQTRMLLIHSAALDRDEESEHDQPPELSVHATQKASSGQRACAAGSPRRSFPHPSERHRRRHDACPLVAWEVRFPEFTRSAR